MNPSALSLSTYSGCFFAKSVVGLKSQEGQLRMTFRHIPITWPQRVGIVASNSYIVIVNAERAGVRRLSRKVK